MSDIISTKEYQEVVSLAKKSLTMIKETVARAIDGDSLELSAAVIVIEDEADRALGALRPVAATFETDEGEHD